MLPACTLPQVLRQSRPHGYCSGGSEVTVQDVRLTGIGLTGGSLDVLVNVKNPNDFRLDARLDELAELPWVVA
mgnify:CR=1 FL=1